MVTCSTHAVSPHGEEFAYCPTCGRHNCNFLSKDGELVYICSRCRACYVCRHKAILMSDGTWMWKCKDGKLRPVRNDGRLRGVDVPTVCGCSGERGTTDERS